MIGGSSSICLLRDCSEPAMEIILRLLHHRSTLTNPQHELWPATFDISLVKQGNHFSFAVELFAQRLQIWLPSPVQEQCREPCVKLPGHECVVRIRPQHDGARLLDRRAYRTDTCHSFPQAVPGVPALDRLGRPCAPASRAQVEEPARFSSKQKIRRMPMP